MEPGTTDGGATGGWPDVTGDEPAVERRDALRWASGGLAAMLAGCPADGASDDTETPPADLPDGESGPQVDFETDYWNTAWERLWTDELVPAFRSETGIEVNAYYPTGDRISLERALRTGRAPDVKTTRFTHLLDVLSPADLQPVASITESAAARNGDLMATPHGGDDHPLLPHGYYADVFQYREDVYEDLGLSRPTSFRGILENARAIDESDRPVRGYGLAATRTGKSRDEFQAYLARMGVSPIGLRWRDPDAKNEMEVHWPEAEIVTLLQFFADLARYSPDPTGIDWSDTFLLYLNGEIAQQSHLNDWVVGVGADEHADRFDLSPQSLVEGTGIAPMPYWESGGIGRGDGWVWEPQLDGHAIFGVGDNTPGAKRWLEWLYADDPSRTASLYTVEPLRLLPAYEGVLDTETYREAPLFQEWPDLYDRARHIQETIVGDHYRQAAEAALDDLVALHVGRQWFYGRLVNQVATGERTPAAAYEWGRDRLERHLEAARERFR